VWVSGAGALDVGAERLGDRVRAQVDREAVHVEPRHPAGGVGQRVGGVERPAAGHDALAHDSQVRRVEALLGGGLDGQRGRVGRARRGVEPDARVDRHPARLRGVEHVTHGLERFTELPGQTAHDVGDRKRVAELRLEPSKPRFGRPRPRARRIGVVRHMNGAHTRTIES
jgi:hypothetical protein